MQRRLSVPPGLLLLVLSFCASGCVSTTSVQVWEPAKADVSGIRRVAVLEFRGPENQGQIARSSVIAELAENGFYEMVDQGQLGMIYGPDGSTDVNRAIQAARSQGVDGLIVGDVVSYDVVDDVQRDQNVQLGGASTKDGESNIAQTLMGMRVENNETINREVSAALSFQLIDVRTGNIRTARRTAHTDAGTMRNGEGYLPARERALTDMMNLCARDIVEIVAPHKVVTEVNLATASWGKAAKEINAGNRRAENGDWDGASEHWKVALELDPESHAAMHNLALASAARMNYPAAERLLDQAVELKQSSLYLRSRSRIRSHKATYLEAMAQHDARGRGAAQPVYAGPQAPPQYGPVAPQYGLATPQYGPPAQPPAYGNVPASASLPSGVGMPGAGVPRY